MREVDEEYRRDRLLSIWRSYGRWILGAVFLALAGFGLKLYLDNRSATQAGLQGEQFEIAQRLLEENQPDKALPELDKIAKESTPGYAGLALLSEGNLLVEKGDAKGAIAKFAALAGDNKYPQAYRELATLRQVALEYDTLKPEQITDRLKALAVKDSPWFGTAGEMVAAAYLAQGKRAEAGKLYGEIAQGGENVPESIRQRAVTITGVLGVDAIDQSKDNQAK